MSEDQPHKAFVAAYSQATTDLVIPLAALRAAELELDAERERRRRVAEERAKLAARQPGLWQRFRAWLGS